MALCIQILHGWFVKIPDLNGTWKAKLNSTSKEGEEKPQDVDGYMVVRQTYSSVSMRFLSAESSSELVACRIIRSEDSIYEVLGVYRNVPNILVRAGSPVHFGGLVLRVLGVPPYGMEGQYWTDRNTQGAIRLSDRQSTLHYDFATAELACVRGRKRRQPDRMPFNHWPLSPIYLFLHNLSAPLC